MKNATLLLAIEAIGSRLNRIMTEYAITLTEKEGLKKSLTWLRNDIQDVLDQNLDSN